ncbi:SMI1/KNR4 family protein [Bordetella genomosp. 1]|uniref:SMI1/KNR4 family protein n=1 Tax=Bordetella genomosp. 1 TaxID=1395607 RepID=A0ABX4EY22_9BORD|nr:SMI1/KNR4 family protein [Bordetella genomosp. 1]OZI63996.1 SMI1/KNR4 family protein [Bordetella genomosp. 1]
MSDAFSPDELRVLREHGIALFAGRVLIDVQPPLDPTRIAQIEALCAGPLPPALLDLWRLTAGGELAYDLHATMDGNEEALSWAELFYDGSDHYRDLAGWIEHEQECAEAAADDEGTPWDGKLHYLPIGGFEYCDRIYVVVNGGPQAGSVVAWKQGLPGWTHALQQDAVATVAPDLYAAFAALCLETDPEDDLDSPGVRLLEYLDERVDGHGLARDLADRLVVFYRAAMLDWRAPLAANTIAAQPRLAHIALDHAIKTDDAGLVRQLAAQGVALDGPLRGSALPLEVALMRQAWRAARALVEAGSPVIDDAIHRIDREPDPALVALLLARGAVADGKGVARCVACGSEASARAILGAAPQDLGADYVAARDTLLADYEDALAKVKRGKLGHYLGADGLAERIARLREFQP